MYGHRGSLYAIAASRDGKRVATGGEDATVRLWDVATQRQGAELTGHTKAISAVAFSPDGTRLASTADDFTARLWDLTVEFADKANLPPFRDTRGLARALTGNTSGAIEDFLNCVEWAQVSGYEDPAERRRHWIAELKAGKNPFSEEVLRELRTE